MSEKDRARIVALLDDNISLINALERTSSSAARYKAALEGLANHSGTPTPGGYSVCDWCGVSVDAHQSWCASAIADRALKGEETE